MPPDRWRDRASIARGSRLDSAWREGGKGLGGRMETKARRRQGGARGSARRGSAPPGLPGRGNSY